MSEEQVVIEGYTEDEINKILESGDPDAIEKLMDGQQQPVSEDKPAADAVTPTEGEESGTDGAEDNSEKQDEESAASGAAEEQQREQDLYVESKSGGNKIPYAVLDETRKERDQLKAANAEMAEKLAQLEASSTRMQTHLEKSGIDLAALQTGEKLTVEQLTELEQLDPAVAHLARITMSQFDRMAQLQQQLEQQLESARSPALDPVELEIRANPSLKTWRESDPDRWETACRYDDLLKQDPAFQNASLETRFAEAVRRTKSLFGDPLDGPLGQNTNGANSAAIAQAAANKVAAAAAAAPRTLTDLGATPQAERSQVETLGDLSEAEMNERLANMSPEQIDKLLAQAG